MGVVTNAVNNANHIRGGEAVFAKVQRSGLVKLHEEVKRNLDKGGQACPIVGECLGVGQGMMLGDLRSAGLNAGLLALYMISIPSNVQNLNIKLGTSSSYQQLMLAAAVSFSNGHQALQNTVQHQEDGQSGGTNTLNDSAAAVPEAGGKAMEVEESNPSEQKGKDYDAEKVANYFKSPEDIFGEVTKKGEKKENDKKEEEKKPIPRPIQSEAQIIQYLNALPSFAEFQDFFQKYKADDYEKGDEFLWDYLKEAAMKLMKGLSECEYLNFEKLLTDGIVKLQRDGETQKPEPVITQISLDVKKSRIVQFGQHNKEDQLHGVGRRIQISDWGYGAIWEGQFENDEINGFARFIRITKHTGTYVYIGNWKNGKYHGYGRIYENGEMTREGLFEAGPFVGGEPRKKEEIKSYDPEKDPIAKEIDFDKYLVEAREKPAPSTELVFEDENVCVGNNNLN